METCLYPTLRLVREYQPKRLSVSVYQGERRLLGLCDGALTLVVPFSGLYLPEVQRIVTNAEEVIGCNLTAELLSLLAAHDIKTEAKLYDVANLSRMADQRLELPPLPPEADEIAAATLAKHWMAVYEATKDITVPVPVAAPLASTDTVTTTLKLDRPISRLVAHLAEEGSRTKRGVDGDIELAARLMDVDPEKAAFIVECADLAYTANDIAKTGRMTRKEVAPLLLKWRIQTEYTERWQKRLIDKAKKGLTTPCGSEKKFDVANSTAVEWYVRQTISDLMHKAVASLQTKHPVTIVNETTDTVTLEHPADAPVAQEFAVYFSDVLDGLCIPVEVEEKAQTPNSN